MYPRLTVSTKESRFTVRCESLARIPNDGLLALSIVAPDTAIRSIRAMLFDPDCVPTLNLQPNNPDASALRLTKYRTDGRRFARYEARVAKLAPHTVHMIARIKLDGFMPSVDDAGLWSELSSPRYTTPLLRGWMPWVRERLIEEDLLAEASGRNTSAGLLSATSDDLDEIVSEGVRRGLLRLKGE